MESILFTVDIQYEDCFSKTERYKSQQYTFLARDREQARQIGAEMFFVSYGRLPEMHISCKAYRLPVDLSNSLVEKVKSIYEQMNSTFRIKTYSEFLTAYEDFEGYELHFGQEITYKFEFQGMVFTAYFSSVNSCCMISAEEIVIKDMSNQRKYIVKNLDKFYYGGKLY